MTIRRFLLLLVCGGAAGIAACSTNSATGRSQFNSVSRDDEIKLGTEAKPELTKEFGGAVTKPELQAYVTEVGTNLSRVTEGDNPSLPWEFTLLNSPVINAFALPGGKVFVTVGLASKMTNEAQLAGVLGHEVGHVTARHMNDQMFRQTVAGGIVSAVGIATGDAVIAEGAGQVAGVTLLKFSREQENEADMLGMRYMSRLHYNPAGQLQVMELLARESQGGRDPEILSTHPYPESRVEIIKNRLKQEYASTQNNPQFSFKEQEFRDRFLSRLATLPPPEHEGRSSMLAAVVLESPETWCAVCRARSH